ncbi:MAG: hypothetical protein ACREDM_10895 [Methylocella sp.]
MWPALRARAKNRRAHHWGKTQGKIGFDGGKVALERPRLRGFGGKEQPLPGWEGAMTELRRFAKKDELGTSC